MIRFYFSRFRATRKTKEVFDQNKETRNECFNRWRDRLIYLSQFDMFGILVFSRPGNEISRNFCATLYDDRALLIWIRYEYIYLTHWYFIEEYFGCDTSLFWKYLWQSAFEMALNSVYTNRDEKNSRHRVWVREKREGARWGHNSQIALCNMDFVLWF